MVKNFKNIFLRNQEADEFETWYTASRGAVVEWLERLAVVRKVAGSSPARVKRLENSLCPPSSEWVPD